MLFLPNKVICEANKGSAFLLFSWHELFSIEAPDTYQPKLLNIPALVQELTQIAERAKKSSKWEKHVKIIQEELKNASEAERSFLDTIPKYSGILDQLCSECNISDTLAIAKLLSPRVKEYDDHAIKTFQDSTLGLPKNKFAANDAIKRIATIALRNGRTGEDFAHLFSEDNFSRTPGEIVTQIISASNPTYQDYTCILAVKGTVQDLRVIGRKAGFDVVSEKHFPDGPNSTEFRDLTSGNVWLSTKAKGTKPLEAAQVSIRRLRSAIDIFNFSTSMVRCLFLMMFWSLKAMANQF